MTARRHSATSINDMCKPEADTKLNDCPPIGEPADEPEECDRRNGLTNARDISPQKWCFGFTDKNTCEGHYTEQNGETVFCYFNTDDKCKPEADTKLDGCLPIGSNPGTSP